MFSWRNKEENAAHFGSKHTLPGAMKTETAKILGPVVQSIVSLTSLLVVKMLTVLVSTIPSSQVFLLKKCEYR